MEESKARIPKTMLPREIMVKRIIDANAKMAALLGRHFCFVYCIALRNPGRERRLADPGKIDENYV
jgi:hypothetical protein